MAEGDSEDDYVASESEETSSVATHDGPSNNPAPLARKTPHYSQPNQKPTRGYLSNNYRDLLNADIEALHYRAQGAGLDVSQIGASRWSSHEKEALFQCLSSGGRQDLAALARAVRTKSEQEVRVYLILLQEGAIAQDAQRVRPQNQIAPMHAEIPAAIEISSECEGVLDLAANALATHVEKHTSQQERVKVGDDWLIDRDVAGRMDLLRDQIKPVTDLNADGSAEAEAEVLKDAHDSAALDTDIDALLRPSSFLQLSRNIFMNNGEDHDLNWHHVDSVSADSTEPAIFRTALEDFHNTTVSIIRRVVQASIFQATSRLRAEDASRKDWSPLGVVREVDVRTAADLLNLPHGSKRYWATVARRCKVGVYSGSNKFTDGRQSTKSGYLLTYDEVESELGFPDLKASTCPPKLDADILDEGEIDDVMEDSELFTEDDSDVSTPGTSLGRGGQALTPASKKRKRALSPSSCHRAEVSHLEALDMAAGIEEERRLWDLLRLPPHGRIAKSDPPVSLLAAKPPLNDASADWRTYVDYQAEWEQPNGMPETKRFRDMDTVGKTAKMKREVLLTKVRMRLESDQEHGSSVKVTISNEGVSGTTKAVT